jgi:hypothetical protein
VHLLSLVRALILLLEFGFGASLRFIGSVGHQECSPLTGNQDSDFPITPISVSWLALVLSLSLTVLRQRLPDVHDLVEAPFVVPTHKALVRAGIDQLALARCHGDNLQLSLFSMGTGGRLARFPQGGATASMIRWEQQKNGDWHGFSGELPVASVTKDHEAEREQWLWTIAGLKRPKGWRKPTGHRTTWLDARRSADAYWEKWMAAASLRPDIGRLALQSIPAGERPKSRRRKPSRA